MSKISRRKWIAKSGATIGTGIISAKALAATCNPTPAQGLGPFYPEAGQNWEDNDLTGVQGETDHAREDAMKLKGVITASIDGRCVLLPNARVEIWQTDDQGKYKHSGDEAQNPGDRDPNFQYFGESRTNEKGEYEFVTIVPGKYSGRTQHIHFRVVSEDRSLSLVTQLYFDRFRENNLNDGIYRSLRQQRTEQLVTAEIKTVSGSIKNECVFDMNLQGRGNSSRNATPSL